MRQTLRSPWNIRAIAFSRDSKLLAVAARHSKQVQIWSLITGALLKTLSGYGLTETLTFSTDATALITDEATISLGLLSLTAPLSFQASPPKLRIRDNWVVFDGQKLP